MGFGGSKSFGEFSQRNATQEVVAKAAVEQLFKELKVRNGKCTEGLGSLQWERAKCIAGTSSFYLLFPFSTLPLTHCPEYVSVLTLSRSLSPAPMALPLFSVSLGLSAPAPHPQRAQQPVSGSGWQGASCDRGLLKMAEAFLFPTMASGIYRRTVRKSCFFTLLHLCRESNPELCSTHFI